MTVAPPVRPRALMPPIRRNLAMLSIITLAGLGSIVAIGVYVSALHVASVRAQAVMLDARIATARAQVGRLDTELTIRSRFAQQERWAPVLGLRAPDAMQYGVSENALRTLAEARRSDLAAQSTSPARPAPAPCNRTRCEPAPPVAAHGYAPEARHDLDALIGDVLR
jgi:hypothetical protein